MALNQVEVELLEELELIDCQTYAFKTPELIADVLLMPAPL